MDALKELYTMASTDVPVEQRQMAKGENHLRPHLIHFNRCKNVLLDEFKIRQSPFWTIHLYMCDGGIVRNLDVKAHGHNNDGIDLEMSRNFLIENCVFDQGDDAVVIKAGRNQDAWRLNTPCENIVIRHCNILKGHTLLGIGSENVWWCTECVHAQLYGSRFCIPSFSLPKPIIVVVDLLKISG
mgnify:CR=1 FL=1